MESHHSLTAGVQLWNRLAFYIIQPQVPLRVLQNPQAVTKLIVAAVREAQAR